MSRRSRLERALLLRRAVEAWAQEPTIQILGNLDAKRLSILSFVVKAPSGAYLHHNFVVAVLNDLFGIQTRGGCSCAGPYGHRLLGIDLERSHQFEAEIATGCEGIKPGWVRVNFNYFIDEAVFDYIVEAVRLVAREGWRLLPDYHFDPTTGLWRHRNGPAEPPLRLSQVSYAEDGEMVFPRHDTTAPVTVLAEYLDEARQILDDASPPDTHRPGSPLTGLRRVALVRVAGVKPDLDAELVALGVSQNQPFVWTLLTL